MLDEKSLEESKRVVTELVKDNRIIRPSAQQEGFFLQKAIDSLRVSKRLFEISEDKNESIDGYMWVVNTAYYSMFFAATSLLANLGKKIDLEVGIHRMTYHALVYFFLVEDSKLQKAFC